MKSFTSSFQVDGIWSSFTPAYFPRFDETLAAWLKCLRPGGWIALTEIDDLFGHQSLSDRTRHLLDGYVEDSLLEQRYDFRMGRKLLAATNRAGLGILKELILPDKELSFQGAALPDVVAAWRTRLDNMQILNKFCGHEIDAVRGDFLDCICREDRRSSATVKCVIAIKPN